MKRSQSGEKQSLQFSSWFSSRLNSLHHVFSQQLINTSLVLQTFIFPLTDSSHVSSWPLHSVIVSLFSSWHCYFHVALQYVSSPQSPTAFYGSHVIHHVSLWLTGPYTIRSTYYIPHSVKDSEQRMTIGLTTLGMLCHGAWLYIHLPKFLSFTKWQSVITTLFNVKWHWL